MPLNKDIENILDPLLATFDETLTSEMGGQLTEIYVSGQAEMITYGKTRMGIPIAYEGPPISQAIDWAEKHSATLVKGMNEETKKRLAHTISKGIENKRGIPGLARDIRGTFADMSKYRSELIARTETANALSTASLDSMKDMEIDGKEWVTAGDDLVSDECLGNEAEGVIPVGQTFSGGVDAPPQHPDCLLPDVRVETTHIISGSRAFYNGEAVELTTENGHKLTITPNHMVLTPLGFMKAKSLHEGDYIIASLDSQRILASINPNDNNGPAFVEDIWHTLMMKLNMMLTTMPVSPEDFYGDAGAFDGDVDIIHPDSLLLSNIFDTLMPEHIDKDILRSRDANSSNLSSLGYLFPLRDRVVSTPGSFIGRGGQFSSLFGEQSGHTNDVGLATIPRRNTSIKQSPADDIPTYVELSRKFQLRFSSLISPQELIKVRYFNYSGHVYDLQTLEQLYIGNGIVVKNCRCAVAPARLPK